MEKVVLITGASSGIGKASAKKLLSEGHKVVVGARRVDQMKDLEELGALAIKMDITSEEDIQNVVNKTVEKYGRIDVLFNNAGYGLYGTVEETSIEDARRQFEVNIFGLARITQLVLPHMRDQKSGTIINTSSMGGKIYTPLGAWYHATKHALEGWSDCLRLELKQFGINVVIVEPGGIETDWGNIAVENMLKASSGGPYEKLVQAVSQKTLDLYNKKGALSPATVIAKVVSKAVNKKRPKTRYVAGKYARSLMFMRKYLGDRAFDFAVMSQSK